VRKRRKTRKYRDDQGYSGTQKFVIEIDNHEAKEQREQLLEELQGLRQEHNESHQKEDNLPPLSELPAQKPRDDFSWWVTDEEPTDDAS
jgi:hypothetical protein